MEQVRRRHCNRLVLAIVQLACWALVLAIALSDSSSPLGLALNVALAVLVIYMGEVTRRRWRRYRDIPHSTPS